MPAELADRTVLVTGGAGFIGSHLVDALAPDNEVRVLDDLSSGDPDRLPDGVELFEADVRDPEAVAEAMAGVDVVFHQAGQVDVGRSVENPIESHSINVDGTLAVLEQARATDARVVFASSTAVYGQPVELPLAEDAQKEPESPYGLEKLTADHYIRPYAALYDLETVALRYFNVYGPRQGGGPYSGVIGIFTEQALAGESLTVHGDGTQTRDFVFVDDVVDANRAAATTDHVGEACNVGTGESITIRELAERLVEITGSSSEIEHVDPRPGDIQQSRADIAAARTHLGFEPAVSIEGGLSAFVEWYEARLES
jgi:UDP-glucose 4-epimerase